MKLYDYCVKLAGKVWRSYNSVALWPWPAILIFNHRSKLTFVDYRHFSHHLKPGDIFLTLGAGDVWKLGETILKKEKG